jgi:hypothetical protein
MSIFTIEITDPIKLAGITAAATAYNISNISEDFVPLTDAQYIQFVMDSASQSYANHYKVT